MLRKLIIFLFVLVLLFCGFTTWLVTTSSGFSWLVTQAQRVVPALRISDAEGRLIDKVYIRQLQYQPDNATAVTVEQIDLQWTPSALLNSLLAINRLHINDIHIDVVPSETEETAEELVLPDISLPIAIELNDVEVSNVTLTQGGQDIPILNRLTTQLQAKQSQLHIEQFHLLRDDVEARLHGEVGLMQPYSANLQYQAEVKGITPKNLTMTGEMTGDTNHLTLSHQLEAPFTATTKIEVSDVFAELHWVVSSETEAINLADLVAEQVTKINRLELHGEGDLKTAAVQLNSRVLQPDFPELFIAANAESEDLARWLVDLNVKLSESQFIQLQGTVDTAEELQANATLAWQNLQWPLEQETPDYQSQTGQLRFHGGLNAYQANLTTVLTAQQQQAELSAKVEGDSQKITLSELLIKGFGGYVNASADANWEDGPVQYQLDADWQDVLLPATLTGKDIGLKRGDIALVGAPEALSLAVQTNLSVDGIDATIAVDGEGDYEKGFDKTDVLVSLGDGTLHYQGQTYWQGEQLVDGQLQLDKLNPGVLAAAWPGELSGQLGINVKQDKESGINAAVNNLSIKGSLRQRPLQLTGAADYSKALILLKQLSLTSGQSSVLLDGNIKDDVLAINLDIDAPSLADFHPAAQGMVSVHGKATGTMTEPALSADINASELAYQETTIDKVNGRIRLGLAADSPLDNDIRIEAVHTPQMDIDSINLRLNGQQQAHELVLNVQSQALNLFVDAAGSWQQEQWQGRFKRFDFSNDQAGDWQLSRQGNILASAKAQQFAQHCWASSNGELCLQGGQNSEGWQTAGSFTRVPISLFSGFAAQLEQLTGEFRGDFAATGAANSAITAHANINLDNASLAYEQEGVMQEIALKDTALNFKTDGSQTTANFHLQPDLPGVSPLQVDIKTSGLSSLIEAPEQASIDGGISAEISDLSMLPMPDSIVEDLAGAFDLDVDIAGTLKQLAIQGQANLSDAKVTVIAAGITLEEMNAKIDGDMNKVNFDYHAKSGDGQLNGQGQFALTDESWQLETHLLAEQFQVLNTPEMLVIAEPDLSINVTPNLTKVTGKVRIPYTELEPAQFNSSVSLSSDVKIKDAPVEAPAVADTEVNVLVSLGDKVKLKAMGFQGRLTGDLQVTGNTNDILMGDGEIQIRDGSYLAYGQLLKVDDSSVRFAGNVENPELNIQAVREGEYEDEDYKAGLRIEGYVSSPMVTLFSDPEMDQDDVLAYILLGKPMEEASASDAAILASAATGMGLQQGAMMGDRIADTFGLDEFSVGGDSADNAAVKVGKYLTPKLYMGYGIGIFEQITTVELRYELSRLWALRAESGTESGIDLLYKLEKGKKRKK